MPDAYLFDMVRGAMHSFHPYPGKKTGKDIFELALEKSAAELAKSTIENEGSLVNPLLSKEMKRAKLTQDILTAAALPSFERDMESAFKIIENEGDQYLTGVEQNLVLEQLRAVGSRLLELDLNLLTPALVKKVLTVSDEAQASILKIGIAKFASEGWEESFAIFTLLSTLDVDQPDYWYRLGLAAQRKLQYDVAIRAYAAAISLATECIGAHLFSAQCYIGLNQYESATAQLSLAKELIQNLESAAEWESFIADMENLLAYSDSVRQSL